MITNRIYDRGAVYCIARHDGTYRLISDRCRSVAITGEEFKGLVDGDLLPHDIINRP